ncbi:MAG: phosphoribosylglycinamide formyltransferase [Defluviitaleaceae bacterium]|nr:phosphoribosylglycinamide formyltransferase [Defluviitaleaceae bacterium]
MKKLCVFASGSGSNFEAIAREIHVSLLVCDKPKAAVIERAKRLKIPFFLVNTKKPREDYEADIIKKLNEHGIQFIALAGYMRLIGETLLNAFENKIVNIHPSLLPSFAGKDGIKQAFDYGVKITGITVHYVDSGIDTGKIIEQAAVEVTNEDTLETLSEKIHKEEHKLYSKVLKNILIK